MSQEMVVAKDGTFAVDWELVSQIIRSFIVARSKSAHATLKIESEWFGPELHQIEVDWKLVNSERKREAPALLADFERRIYTRGLRSAQIDLLGMVEDTRKYRERFDQRMQQATERTLHSVKEVVEFWEGMITATKLVRDLAGGTLVALAAASGGGLAIVGAAGYDGVMQGVTKYQETGKIGAAIMKMSGTFQMDIIPGAKGAKAVLVFKTAMGGAYDWMTSIVEGNTMERALRDGFVGGLSTLGGEMAGQLLDSEFFKKALSRAAVPIGTKLVHQGAKTVAAVRREQVRNTMGRFMVTKGSSSIPVAMIGHGSAGYHIAMKQARETEKFSIAHQVIIADKMIVQNAIMGPDACYAAHAFP